MDKRYFEVVASGNSGVGKINIYGIISGWYDDVNAVDFLAAFNALEKTCHRINVHINSPGGSVYEGLPIANAIKASEVEVHTYVDGIAFSMGAIIAVSAPKGNVHMAKGSLLMLHSASSYAYGNAEELKKQAEDLGKFDDVLATFVEDRTGKTSDEVKTAYFDGVDHFYTAAEAKAEGLIDHIENYEAKDTPENVQNMSVSQVAAWYQKPKQIQNSDKNNMFNKFNKLSALAKVAVADINATLLEEVNNQIQKEGVEGVTVVTDSYLESVSNIEAEKEALETKVKDFEALETKVKDLEAAAASKDSRIVALEKEVKDLGGKPASTPGAPAKEEDKIPSGDGKVEVEDNFETSVDREYAAYHG